MKEISTYINERLKFTKNFKSSIIRPESYSDLISTLARLVDERGLEADLNDVDISGVVTLENVFGAYLSHWNNINYDKFNPDISQWDVSHVKKANAMFFMMPAFDCDLSKWDVSNMVIMRSMFYGCSKFNQDLSKWDVSNVEDMSYMFKRCENFNQDISEWNVTSCMNMDRMFDGCKRFNQDLNKWDVSNVQNMENMFYHCDSLNKRPSWYNDYLLKR